MRPIRKITKLICENFSRNFFQNNGFNRVLELATDKVTTVRMKLAQILPQIYDSNYGDIG